ncbi:hypothetical protein HYC85_010667 [Camellia sinensis]|uniref:Uncharacterized protein n=1 Tax=Camellia sinensis TaxID=4442 RepID=A0A7J7HIQ0_CAMSI|nr:hypothetical protein HYC85_010667 [Camellia sinensis]
MDTKVQIHYLNLSPTIRNCRVDLDSGRYCAKRNYPDDLVVTGRSRMELESEVERDVKVAVEKEMPKRNLDGGRGERFEEFGSGVPEEEEDASMEMK